MKSFLPKQIVTTSLVLFLTTQALQATTYTDNGSTATYHLYSGDVLQISSGIYTGSILTFESGATIKVLSGATFKPQEIKLPHGKIINIGTTIIDFPSSPTPVFAPLEGFELDNYGMIQILNETFTHNTQTWLNRFGGTIHFKAKVELNPGLNITNNGTILSEENFFIHSSTNFLNNNKVDVKKDISFNGGVTHNKGTIQAKGNMYYNIGNTHTNSCRLLTEGNFQISYGLLNDGVIWLKGSSTSTLTNYGVSTLALMPNSIVKAPEIVNYGAINGNGSLYFTGNSYNINGIVGSGSGSDNIRFFDASRVNPTGTFDYNWGTGIIHSNVKFETVPEPDESYMPAGCADLSLAVPLPLKWHFFQAQAKQNTPALSWKTSDESLSHYIVERSTDRQTFQAIATIMAKDKETHTYTDQTAKAFNTVYYRIKAIETTGSVQYSEIRKVDLNNHTSQPVSIAPNPFVNAAIVSLHVEKAQKLQLIVRNTNGHIITIQEYGVRAGTHKIAITIAPQLPKGAYLIEVRTPEGLIGTVKSIKQ